jgi:sterol desaturase/sphingolipid hydroxylase (fatty acid hydroxylase superfamily)
MELKDLVLYAAPLFIASVILEARAFRKDRLRSADRLGSGRLSSDRTSPDAVERRWLGYDRADARTSITMGVGSVFTGLGWQALFLLMATRLHGLTPLRISTHAWWGWALLFVCEDVSYYAYHRAGHEIRVLWASHVVHHSSEFYNLSTALRQTWVPLTQFPFWLWLPLVGFQPWAVLVQQSISLIYQFWIHTERIGRLWAPFEYVFNTPSHHRVHHGSQQQYLDRNYGGILIVWDRLFRSFEPEGERVVYGLTKNIRTHNPVRVAFGEYAALFGDVRRAPRWRDKVGHLVHGPAWAPATARQAAA